jgi:hypothetical protein
VKKCGSIQLALELYKNPALMRSIVSRPIPSDILSVLRVVSGSETDRNKASALQGTSPELLRVACAFYLQSVMLGGRSSDTRLLGLPEVFSVEILRLHKRLILKWLHPDVNNNKWESQLCNRVVEAAARLEAVEATIITSSAVWDRVERTRSGRKKNNDKMRFLSRQKPLHNLWIYLLKRMATYATCALILIAVGSAAILILNKNTRPPEANIEASN